MSNKNNKYKIDTSKMTRMILEGIALPKIGVRTQEANARLTNLFRNHIKFLFNDKKEKINEINSLKNKNN